MVPAEDAPGGAGCTPRLGQGHPPDAAARELLVDGSVGGTTLGLARPRARPAGARLASSSSTSPSSDRAARCPSRNSPRFRFVRPQPPSRRWLTRSKSARRAIVSSAPDHLDRAGSARVLPVAVRSAARPALTMTSRRRTDGTAAHNWCTSRAGRRPGSRRCTCAANVSVAGGAIGEHEAAASTLRSVCEADRAERERIAPPEVGRHGGRVARFECSQSAHPPAAAGGLEPQAARDNRCARLSRDPPRGTFSNSGWMTWTASFPHESTTYQAQPF